MKHLLTILCTLLATTITAQTPIATPKSWRTALANYHSAHQHQFVVIVPSYNNARWHQKNLESILAQAKTYPHFRVIYLDDASTDGTGNLVENYLREHDTDRRVTLIKNKTNIGGLGNIYQAAEQCNDEEICLELDGDDWFNGTDVLELLNKVYNRTNTWITYGQYRDWPSGRGSWRKEIPYRYIAANNYRGNWGWIAPLRSWRAWLFKKIDKKDLLVNLPTHPAHGQFFPLSWDHAMMWPMCEMAAGKITFIPDVLYIYNRNNPLSDTHKSSEQYSFVDYLCENKRGRYAPLTEDQVHKTLWQQLAQVQPAVEKHMVIIVPSYNNAAWYKKNLDSIFAQNYSNYTIRYYDDCSSDNTAELVRAYAQEKGLSHRLELVRNETNIGGLGNIYHGVHASNDTDIMINLDGDDWFNGTNVLALLNKVYEDPNVWFTYGQYTNWPWQQVDKARPVPNSVIQSGRYRGKGWEKPLRTWRAWLFKKIDKQDLMHEGSFFKTSWDHAFMLPMFEMAAGRFKFIPDILYVYNRANTLCDDKVRKRKQWHDASIIHRKKPYPRIDGAQ